MTRSLKGLYHLLTAVLAVLWFRFPSRRLTVIGVTGTDGKTTTSTLIYNILKAAGYKTSMITSVHAVIAGKQYDTGFHVTTPNAWWVQKYLREAVDHGDTHVVLEVTSHALSQHRVFGVFFTVGVLTNVTHEHLDWHKTFTRYFLAKLSLLNKSRTAIFNCDDEDICHRVKSLLPNKQTMTYGINGKADITPRTYSFETKLPGEFNQYNCLAALAAAETLHIPKEIARHAVKEFSGVSGRMEVVVTKPYTVIVDFAHTPNAIEQVLKTVRSITKGRLIHVFGSAGLRDYSKRPLMGSASARYADIIVLTEEDYRTEDVHKIIRQIQEGIPHGKVVQSYPDRSTAIRFSLSLAKKGDLVILTGKGHERSLCRGKTEYPWSDQQEVKKFFH